MKKHFPWMIVGCLAPLLLIFLAPVIGLGSGMSLFIFILAMFACHLLMPMHHHEDKNRHYPQPNSETFKATIHEHNH